jgi:hypothetical protein
MELESIILHAEENSKLNFYYHYDKQTRLIENLDFATEFFDLIKTLDESYYNGIKTIILQLSEEQHMDEPRILITIDDEVTFLTLPSLENEKPEFYESLIDFQERLLNYLIETEETNA